MEKHSSRASCVALMAFMFEGYSHKKTASASCFTHSIRNYVYIFIELTNWREMLSNRYVFHVVSSSFSLSLIHDNLRSRFTDH